ncbi:hydrolase 1, exosortase A system-associated [Erythrobacter sp. QSSC1-22B]|uniref:hydrolase 1, exosortase A system-associated n=1 Tax=Erythrobacter sp. QSSC1-22B TaxID=1860125 RepID=UPI000804C034|nr:hydrolase 1, exosortase A system-associated [Erythrobacter sp. QSSC1-22B]OBX20361.1 hydrolase 1, exosortase A system-associated [Erythrobacter sp. QSSC1-22B]
MSRLALTFNCQGATLAGTLDTAPGTSGLLLVSGGNEIRSGAFAGQARFAAEIARAGFPVFRFDRRGTGDSEGPNRGFRNESEDIAAALAAFRAMTPQLGRVIGMGNCDAASALMLAGGARCDALVLSNPWTIEESSADSTPPAAAIRARYLAKLKNPREVVRLLSGEVDFRKLLRGVAKAATPKAAPSTLAAEMRAGLEKFDGPVRILLAEADRTAQVFAENWGEDERIVRCAGAGHAYVEPHARQWLREQVLKALRG